MRKLQLSTCLLSLVLFVSCRTGKLLTDLVSVSCCHSEGFPAPTNSFISDLQQKAWETLTHAHTHTRQVADTCIQNTHTHTYKCTTFQTQLEGIHSTCTQSKSLCASGSKMQAQLCTGVYMQISTYMYAIISIHLKACRTVQSFHTTDTHTDFQVAQVLMMTSSALKTRIFCVT